MTANTPPTTLDLMLDEAAAGITSAWQPQIVERDSDTERRQAAQAVRAALRVLAEALTYREVDGTVTGWRMISGEQIAVLAACIRDDDDHLVAVASPPQVIDQHAARIACERARLKS
jgi:hypothetical protein